MTVEANYVTLFVTGSMALLIQYDSFDDVNISIFITITVIELLGSSMFNMTLSTMLTLQCALLIEQQAMKSSTVALQSIEMVQSSTILAL